MSALLASVGGCNSDELEGQAANMAGTSILVVDDDKGLRDLVADFLTDHGFYVSQAASVAEMRVHMSTAQPDLIILDLMMPGEDGLQALKSMNGSSRPPVIMLSAMGSDADRIIGLEMGADDYLAKPCNPRELLARVRAVLRRSSLDEHEVLNFGGWEMDLATHELTAPKGQSVKLSQSEWKLLEALLLAGRRVLSRDELMTRIGGHDFEAFDRSIDIAISRLRRKLETHDGNEIIRTVRGEGYGIAPAVNRK